MKTPVCMSRSAVCICSVAGTIHALFIVTDEKHREWESNEWRADPGDRPATACRENSVICLTCFEKNPLDNT